MVRLIKNFSHKCNVEPESPGGGGGGGGGEACTATVIYHDGLDKSIMTQSFYLLYRLDAGLKSVKKN